MDSTGNDAAAEMTVQLTVSEYEQMVARIRQLENQQPPSAAVSQDDRRKALYEKTFFTNNKSFHNTIKIGHQYGMDDRMRGTTYDKETYFQRMQRQRHQSGNGVDEELPATTLAISDPTALWNPIGGKNDYFNGTIHFPLCMPPGKEFLASHTIMKKKLSFPYFLFLAGQLAYQQQQQTSSSSSSSLAGDVMACDDGLQRLVDILSEKNPTFTKQCTPRNISNHQTKELLHAWIWVYVYDKKEYIKILDYYLRAGYIVMITTNQGGLHI